MENTEEEKITVAINKAIWEEFKKYCAVNAYKISKKIELLLKEEIEKGPKTKSLIDIFKGIVEKQKELETSKTVELKEPLKIEPTISSEIKTGKLMPPTNHIISQVVNREDNPKMMGSYNNAPTIEKLMVRKKI